MFYAVANGRQTGVFNVWAECEAQVKGFKGAIYKKFKSLEEAQEYCVYMAPTAVVEDKKEEITMSKNIVIDIEGLNEGQKIAVETFVKFMSSDELCMSLSGYAGTGKTFTLGRISAALSAAHIAVQFTAPTNKAVIVMGKNGIRDAKTVHKFIYKYELDNGRYVKTRRDGSEFNNGLIVMDESSMADDEILRDLEEYAQRANCKILYVGDPGQLPPVKKSIRKVFEEFTFKAQLMQVMRQANGSRILDMATTVRNGNLIVPATTDKDVAIVNSNVAFSNYIQKLQEGKDATFIVGRNDTRVSVNLRARAALGFSGKPVSGEKFIAINNTERYANGEEFSELGEYAGNIVLNGVKGYVYKTPKKSEQIELFDDKDSDKADSYIVVLPTFQQASFGIVESVSGECSWLFSEHQTRAIVNSKTYYTANCEVVVATFAYAITGHKSQGSQWDYVFVEETFGLEAVKWFYTVVTRAAKGLVLSKSIKYRALSWSQIEKLAYGKTVETAPAIEATSTPAAIEAPVPKKWTVRYFDKYEMF